MPRCSARAHSHKAPRRLRARRPRGKRCGRCSGKRRATVESRIKPEDRATYQKLQAELDAIRNKALALREKALRAYIADVQGGKTPEVARANANAAVAQEAAALQQARANLMSDARALVQKYPQLGRALNFDRPGEVLHSGRRDGRGGKFGMRLAPPYQKGFVKPQNRRR